MSEPALITLTTDFGTADGYVGAMKGRILTVAPGARVVDISHEIAPHNVAQGAWCLKRAVPRFPPGTVHVAVVDPGVGSARQGIVMETERFLLVGPDNGVLSLAAREDGIRRVRAISEAGDGWRKSDTFDGLELFAPVAACLAAGMAPAEIGRETVTWSGLEEEEPRCAGDRIEGRIVFFDRFGNAITNIARHHLGGRAPLEVTFADGRPARLGTHYAGLGVAPSDPREGAAAAAAGALWNSDGRLELAVYRGSARERCHLAEGMAVRLRLGTE